MIRMLRKIRKINLLKGKRLKYLKYATGEIVLLMLGVLIALQVNNWNQARLNGLEEKQLLAAIRIKMKHNLFQTQTAIMRYNNVLESAIKLINLQGGKSKSFSEKDINLSIHDLHKRFLVGNSNKTTIYDEMLGSGKLNLIKSQELRSVLTALKANFELLASYEELQNSFVDNQLSPYLNENIDNFTVALEGYSKDTSLYDQNVGKYFTKINLEQATTSNQEVLRDRTFINLLSELINHTSVLLPIYDRIDGNISRILKLAEE